MQIVHKLTLDCAKQGTQAVISVACNDSNSHILMVDFCLDGQPLTIGNGIYASFYARKPDGREVLDSCVCYGEGSAYPHTVVHIISSDTTSAVGEVSCRIVLGDTVSTLYSPRFSLRVEENEYLDSQVTSGSEYSQLIMLVSHASDYAEKAQAWATGEKGEASVSSADPQYRNNAKYYAELAKSYLSIDGAVSDSSENAVQNKVIKAYVDERIASSIGDALTSSL